uniref:IMS import disulfide relay-system CHCH-CHCH-like Cx9C domain-containing protein n=2 Tax=Oncorhynchus tshawytscha TaxID=74940 RepID=A0AAZ3RAH6_ONCTS
MTGLHCNCLCISQKLFCMSVSSSRQVAMDITAKCCHKEMESYGQCVTSHPSTWQQHCQDLKMKVAQCTSSQYAVVSDNISCACSLKSMTCLANFQLLVLRVIALHDKEWNDSSNRLVVPRLYLTGLDGHM